MRGTGSAMGRSILEMGVSRAILRRYRMWEATAQDIDLLKEAPSPGRALSTDRGDTTA